MKLTSPMAISLILLPAILTSLFISLPKSNALDSKTLSYHPNQQTDHSYALELEEAKLRIARLESIFEERIGDVDAKNQLVVECEKRIEELNVRIDRLQTALSSSGDDYASAVQKISDLEEEVRLLWADSRKNNFEIHALEHKALDAETKLQEVNSKVGELSEIVSEQWIQIQQLEQALHMAEVRLSKARKALWRKCPFVKFFVVLFEDCLKIFKGIFDPFLPKDGSLLLFWKLRALQIFSAAKDYHYQMQGIIRNAMRSNELTAALAHEEVVFFVASALVAFPIMTACMLLLSQFS